MDDGRQNSKVDLRIAIPNVLLLYALYNSLPLNVGRTIEYDGMSFLRLFHYIIFRFN